MSAGSYEPLKFHFPRHGSNKILSLLVCFFYRVNFNYGYKMFDRRLKYNTIYRYSAILCLGSREASLRRVYGFMLFQAVIKAAAYI